MPVNLLLSLRNKHLTKELSATEKNDLKAELIKTNFQRIINLDFLLFFVYLILIIVDYQNYLKGLWTAKPGYRYLFYVHLLSIAGVAVLLFTAYLTKLSLDASRLRHRQIFVNLSCLYIMCCSILCSVVDQYLHGEIIVFVISIMTYAVAVIQRPLITLVIFGAAYIALMAGITYVQTNFDILRGHYINGTLIVILAYFLSFILYSAKVRGFISRKTIENQKAKLEQANEELSLANYRLQESLKALDESQNIIFTLALALESKDQNTHGHSERVVKYALALADYLGLDDKDKVLLHRASVLHDIGKIGIPDVILNKPFPLNADEWEVMRSHPERGEAICSKLKFAQEILPIIRHHHERYDGTGYPDRLRGEDIPFLARIVSIADAVDAITSRRSYRTARTMEYALSELENCSKTQFDPVLVRAFKEIYKHSAVQ